MAKGYKPEFENIEKILGIDPNDMASSIGCSVTNIHKSYRKQGKIEHFTAIAIYAAFKKSDATLKQLSLQIKTLEQLNKDVK